MSEFACPVCTGKDWVVVERFSYQRNDSNQTRATRLGTAWCRILMLIRVVLIARPRSHIITREQLNEYQKRRREVLFKIWFPNRGTVLLESVHCSTCGFMTYSPRPSDDDVFEKYKYLKRVEPDIGGQVRHTWAGRLDAHRAERIYALFSEHVNTRNAEILDYGGGDGKLMRPFLKAGHRCSIADYNDTPIRGVRKVGNDISEIESSQRYDFIICSHVLEHVSNFPRLVLGLRSMLKPGGMIYAEVPQEIWSGIRIEADPVTHINFFTQNSFLRTFIGNGFGILKHRQEISSYGSAHMEVIWLLAQNGTGAAQVDLRSDVDDLLYPRRISSLLRIFHLFLAPTLRDWSRSFLSKRA
jgi:hypothetical protein